MELHINMKFGLGDTQQDARVTCMLLNRGLERVPGVENVAGGVLHDTSPIEAQEMYVGDRLRLRAAVLKAVAYFVDRGWAVTVEPQDDLDWIVRAQPGAFVEAAT